MARCGKYASRHHQRQARRSASRARLRDRGSDSSGTWNQGRGSGVDVVNTRMMRGTVRGMVGANACSDPYRIPLTRVLSFPAGEAAKFNNNCLCLLHSSKVRFEIMDLARNEIVWQKWIPWEGLIVSSEKGEDRVQFPSASFLLPSSSSFMLILLPATDCR